MSGGGHGGGGFSMPYLHEVEHFIEKLNDKGGFVFSTVGLMMAFALVLAVFAAVAPGQNALNWGVVLLTSPIWLPILIGRSALARFIIMRRMQFHTTLDWVLLELRIPREILKSPAAMETVFRSLNIGPGESTWYAKYVLGKTRPWWSLEMASFGGEIHFFVYTRISMRRAVESYFYAQYPEIEIIEAKDYARLKDPSHKPYRMYACEYGPTGPAAFPIRTYVDYDLDKPGLKPELQVDPFAQVLEILGAIGPKEEIWIQIIIRTAKGEKYRGKKKANGDAYTWKDDAQAFLEELRTKHVHPVTGFPNTTEGQKQAIHAVEEKLGKPAFDVGIRAIYLAPETAWGNMSSFVGSIWKPFGLQTQNVLSDKFSGYPWEDMSGRRLQHEMHEAVEFYRHRAYFHPPYRGHWMTMSTEELATIFHIPSSIFKTPGLPRIGSTTVSAPPNLPS